MVKSIGKDGIHAMPDIGTQKDKDGYQGNNPEFILVPTPNDDGEINDKPVSQFRQMYDATPEGISALKNIANFKSIAKTRSLTGRELLARQSVNDRRNNGTNAIRNAVKFFRVMEQIMEMD